MTSNHEIYEEDTLEKNIIEKNVTNNERFHKGPWGPQFRDQQDPSWVHKDARIVPIIETDDYLEYQLPFGWKKVGKKRRNDGINGRWDFYIYTPSGEQLRSNPEISNYLDTYPNIKSDRQVTNTNRPDHLTLRATYSWVGGAGGAGGTIAPKFSNIPPALCSSENSTKLPTAKGQLISKCPFGVFKSTKKTTKFFMDFCPSL